MKKVLIFVYIALACPVGAFAQSKKPTAQEVIEKYLKAIGGKKNLAKVKSWEFMGNTYTNDIYAPLRVLIKGHNIRTEVDMLGQKLVLVRHNGTYWEWNPLGKNYPEKTNNVLIRKPTDFDQLIYPKSLLASTRQKRFEVGEGTLNKQKVYTLSYFDKGTQQKEVYIFGKQSFLLIKSQIANNAIVLGKYKKHKLRLMIPQSFKVASGRLKGTLINNIKVNPKITHKVFRMPKRKPAISKYAGLVAKGKILPADKNLTAEQIVAAYGAKYPKVLSKTLVIKGIRTVGLAKITVFEYYTKGGKYRNENIFGNKRAIEASNGKVSWEENQMLPNAAPVIKGKVVRNTHAKYALTMFDDQLVNYKKDKSNIIYVCREYVGKQLCHKIKLLWKGKRATYYYLGVKDYLLYKRDEADVNISFYMLKYKSSVAGPVAYKFVSIFKNDITAVFNVKKYTFNQPIDNKIFEFPGKEVKDK